MSSLQVKWKTYFGGTGSTPAVVTVDGTPMVFIPNGSGTIFAMNAASGVIIWQLQLPVTAVYSSPTVVNKRLYVGGGDGRLYAVKVSATAGSVLWSYPRNPAVYSYVYSSPVVVSGIGGAGAASFSGLHLADTHVAGGNDWSRGMVDPCD